MAPLQTQLWPRIWTRVHPVRLARAYADSYRGLSKRVWLLCLVFFINRAGTMVLPFLGLYATVELGYSAARAAGILVAFGLGSIVGSYLGGKLTHRMGAVAVQRVALLGGGAAFLTLPFFRTFETLAAAVFVASIFNDAFRPAAMTAVVEAAPAGARTRSLALIRLAANLGFAIGPAMGGLLASLSYDLLFIADGLTCIAAAGALTLWVSEMESWEERSQRPRSARRAWADGPFLLFLVAIFFLGASLFQIPGALPVFLHRDAQLSERAIGALLALSGLMVALTEMPLVKALERFSPMKLVGIGGLVLCVGFSLHAFVTGIPGIALVVMVWTLGEMISFPFGNTIVAGRGGPGASGEYMGLYMATFSIASLAGPAGGVWAYEQFGKAIWLGIGACGPIVLLICMALAPRFDKEPEADPRKETTCA